MTASCRPFPSNARRAKIKRADALSTLSFNALLAKRNVKNFIILKTNSFFCYSCYGEVNLRGSFISLPLNLVMSHKKTEHISILCVDSLGCLLN